MNDRVRVRCRAACAQRRPALALLVWLAAAAVPAGAQTHHMANPRPAGQAASFWTAERLRAAAPLPLAAVAEADLEAAPEEASTGASPAGGDAQPPLLPLRPTRDRLFDPAPESVWQEDLESLPDEDVGTSRAHFSSSRLVPLSADRFFPYTTVGKLFFNVPGRGPASCSAAVIRQRILLTAGHCVHSGTATPGFHRDFLFVPAYRDGLQPFGVWDWQHVWVTNTWATGGARFPNAADYAILEIRDRSDGARIGNVLGFLGWQSQALHPNHAHLLGYPANLDGGEKLHQVTAGSFRTVSPNCVEYGSDMRNGSSGGPWIQSFGVLATGQSVNQNGRNRVVGVTSFGSVQTAPKSAFSSIFDNRFVNMLNLACANRAGNCA